MNIFRRLTFSFFLLFLSPFVLSDSADAQKLHALLVSDQSEWAKWGEYLPNITMDSTNMFVALFNNVPESDLDFRPLPISMEPGSPAAILREIEQTRVGSDDTILFYFTGHGETDNKGHYLNLEKGKLYRAEIRKALLKKQARLAVILTDCCNQRSDKFSYFAPAADMQPPQTVVPLFQSLFFEPSGLVDINASSPGENAFFFVSKTEEGIPKGSLFTTTLTDYVRENSRNKVTWDQLITEVTNQVYRSFLAEYPKGVASASKGNRQRQSVQTVNAISYPGMPVRKGPRTGITVRDHAGTGALISEVRADYPGEKVFDLKSEDYVSLKVDQVIIAANGQSIEKAKDFADIVKKSSKPVIRLTVLDPQSGQKNFLMRLRY